MTTRVEVAAALALPQSACARVNLQDVDVLRGVIRQLLQGGDFEPGSVVELLALWEIAEERGFSVSSESDELESAAAVLLEGLLLVSIRGTKTLWFMWPGSPGSTNFVWRSEVESRRKKIQQIAARSEK